MEPPVARTQYLCACPGAISGAWSTTCGDKSSQSDTAMCATSVPQTALMEQLQRGSS